jgi:RHS repeat-associated protein
LATTEQLSENSHQGFEGIKATLCLAEIDANSNTASGMQPCLRRNGTGSRCSGKERDSESGLDFFQSRYFSSAQGRFTSPDVMLAKKEWLSDPQRWNRYAYVRNNPLKYIDPEGEDLIIYMFFGKDLTEEQRKYLQANMAKIQASIAEKFKNAGVKDVEFREGSSLTYAQKSMIEKTGNREYGIGQLYFVDKSLVKDTSALGGRSDQNQSIVFLDRVAAGLDASKQQDLLDFRIGEVAAHELGHGQRFQSDPAWLNFIKDIFGAGNLMGEGQGMPARPKQFDPSQDRTRRAIDEINRIGDKTPKK